MKQATQACPTTLHFETGSRHVKTLSTLWCEELSEDEDESLLGLPGKDLVELRRKLLLYLCA